MLSMINEKYKIKWVKSIKLWCLMMKYERFTWKTEKLQHSDDEVLIVVDNANEDWKGHILNTVDMLNKLNDERMMYRTTIDKRIVELEKDIDIYKYEEKKHSESARKLYEENEKLRNENERLRQLYEVLDKLDVKNKQLREKNEQLRKTEKNYQTEIKRLKCMNNQLEKRLDYSIAYDMEECE